METDDGLARDAALDVVESILDAVETGPTPVPVREVWVYGDVAVGLDPVARLDVYVTKDLLLRDEEPEAVPDLGLGVEGIGRSVSAEWAAAFPEHVRANDAGHAAPARCLAAHLLPDEGPIHLEVCNAPFDENVTRRLEAALATDAYERIVDPRGVRLWADGRRATESLAQLRAGELAFPTLAAALEMLGTDGDRAAEAAAAVRAAREGGGRSVRSDVV
jgi:hypothetical protein